MKRVFTLLNLLLTLHVVSQNEQNNWFFGNNAGLNFSSGNPVPLLGSQMQTIESCASISDVNGNLLFYTNGLSVWNANHTIMPNGNGLLGDISAICGIIPKPDNPGFYYILVNDANYNGIGDGFTYSEVDMSLDGGLGDITALKNVQLNSLNGEWISAVQHSNCQDIWILTHGIGVSSTFLAYLVTESGINSNPVSTDISYQVPAPLSGSVEGAGILKAGPSGDLLAMTFAGFTGTLELLNFDRSTGVVLNTSNLYTYSGVLFDRPYGVEFSRSGNFLYVGDFMGDLYQYDLQSPDIAASRTYIGGLNISGEIGQLQLAPNDKIYVNTNNYTNFGATTIGVINNPELNGINAGYQTNSISLGGNSAIHGLPWYYLPSSTATVALDLGSDTVLCLDSSLTLNTGIVSGSADYLWSTGATTPTIIIDAPGTYWLTASIDECLPSSDTIQIAFEQIDLSHNYTDTSGCAPLTVNLNAVNQNVSSWSWDLGDGTILSNQSITHTFDEVGDYTIILSGITENNCPVTDSISSFVEVLLEPIADFMYSPSTDIEINDEILFSDQSFGAITSWNWSLGDGTNQTSGEFMHAYTQGGSFEVVLTVVDSNGCAAQTSQIITIPVEGLIYVPNSFSPNNDGLNDVFQAVDLDGIIAEFLIFNRWGELIWQQTEDDKEWEGYYNGFPLQSDVYTWQIKTVVNKVPSSILNGHVNLIR